MANLRCRSNGAWVNLGLVLSLVLVVLSSEASAQGKKVSGTGKFGPIVSQSILLPDDGSKHEISLVNRPQTWNSSDADWNNVAVNQFAFANYVEGNGFHYGYNVNVHPGGDKTFITYEGQTTRTAKPDGSWEAKFEGKLRLTGGTGKFKGIKGDGTYIGKASAPGGPVATSASFEWNAEYTVSK
jgi:hypothetical protein